jgi:hypothetical protein
LYLVDTLSHNIKALAYRITLYCWYTFTQH